MQRQRGELVPIGDALSGMGGPVKSIRDATPQPLGWVLLRSVREWAEQYWEAT